MSKLMFKDADQVKKGFIDYWVDLIDEELNCFSNVETTKSLIKQLRDNDELKIITIDNTGIFTYVITPDFKGGRCLSEIIFYIRKEDRGSLSLVKKYLKTVEDIARREHCNSIKIGANTGYNDESFLRLLKIFGYVDDTVCKYI